MDKYEKIKKREMEKERYIIIKQRLSGQDNMYSMESEKAYIKEKTKVQLIFKKGLQKSLMILIKELIMKKVWKQL